MNAESAAVTPGQAAYEAFVAWRAERDPMMIWADWTHPMTAAAHEGWEAAANGAADWFAGCAPPVARQAQPAPGLCACGRPHQPDPLTPRGEQPAPELAAARPGEALAADNARLREQLAEVLGWFTEEPVVSSRRYASATRAQLARAYKDGALTVPEELRRFL